ncbi:MAG: nucleotidyltransferase family protein [Planctomycetota bacterium]
MGGADRDHEQPHLGSGFSTSSRITIDKPRIEAFCRKHALSRLAFFGSVLREDFRPDSDVDVLVEFQPGRTPGFFRLFEIEDELSEILGRKTDLKTAEDLSPYFRDEVVRTAEPFYVAA